MLVDKNHNLTNVKPLPLPGGATNVPVLLVIHFTAGMSAQSSFDWWKNPKAKGASAHLLIDRDGTAYQCRPFNKTCGHAGVSKWKHPKTGVVRTGCNAFSIGIELANAGDSVSGAPPKAFGKYALPAGATRAKHRNGGKETLWENYTPEQIAACFAVSKVLVDRYKLADVAGHEDIAPSRKNDPGPAFPMLQLRQHCGFSGLPFVNR